MMTIRGYGAMATGVLGAIFGFDALWNFTQMDAIKALFLAMFVGLVAVVVYAFATEPRKNRKPRYDWVTDEMGLSYMRRHT